MAKIPEYPPILSGDLRKDVQNMHDFLARLVQELERQSIENEERRAEERT